MIGSFVTRGVTMLLGYVYPAYECFKIVEQRRPNIEILRFWCQYWIIIALITVVERFGDAFISWVPMYNEAKLAFIVYLWYPKTRGTTYIYSTFLRPYVTSHESEIDQHLNELRTRALDLVVLYWQNGASFAQSKFFEILQYIASQSNRQRPAGQAPQNYPAPPPPPPPPAGFHTPPPAGGFHPPPPGAGFHPSPPPPGFEASAPPAPSVSVYQPPPPPAGLHPTADAGYKPGFYPNPVAYRPPQPSVLRSTLREEIDLDELDEGEEHIIPPADASSSRYMTRSRQRATATSNRGW